MYASPEATAAQGTCRRDASGERPIARQRCAAAGQNTVPRATSPGAMWAEGDAIYSIACGPQWDEGLFSHLLALLARVLPLAVADARNGYSFA